MIVKLVPLENIVALKRSRYQVLYQVVIQYCSCPVDHDNDHDL